MATERDHRPNLDGGKTYLLSGGLMNDFLNLLHGARPRAGGGTTVDERTDGSYINALPSASGSPTPPDPTGLGVTATGAFGYRADVVPGPGLAGTLACAVENAVPGRILTYQWSLLSTDRTCTIHTPNLAVSSVDYWSAYGPYTFQIVVSDGVQTVAKIVLGGAAPLP